MKLIAAIARKEGFIGLFILNTRGARVMTSANQAAGAAKFKTWFRKSKKPIDSVS
jgi:hypothetical protein